MPLIEPGKKAPAFSLKDQHGNTHRLTDYQGNTDFVFLSGRPRWRPQESCDFQAALPQLKRRDAVVLGVSILDEASKSRFANKHGLTFPLLADADHEIARKDTSLAAEIPLWPIVYGDLDVYLSNRSRWQGGRALGQRESGRARRYGRGGDIVSAREIVYLCVCVSLWPVLVRRRS